MCPNSRNSSEGFTESGSIIGISPIESDSTGASISSLESKEREPICYVGADPFTPSEDSGRENVGRPSGVLPSFVVNFTDSEAAEREAHRNTSPSAIPLMRKHQIDTVVCKPRRLPQRELETEMEWFRYEDLEGVRSTETRSPPLRPATRSHRSFYDLAAIGSGKLTGSQCSEPTDEVSDVLRSCRQESEVRKAVKEAGETGTFLIPYLNHEQKPERMPKSFLRKGSPGVARLQSWLSSREAREAIRQGGAPRRNGPQHSVHAAKRDDMDETPIGQSLLQLEKENDICQMKYTQLARQPPSCNTGSINLMNTSNLDEEAQLSVFPSLRSKTVNDEREISRREPPHDISPLLRLLHISEDNMVAGHQCPSPGLHARRQPPKPIIDIIRKESKDTTLTENLRTSNNASHSSDAWDHVQFLLPGGAKCDAIYGTPTRQAGENEPRGLGKEKRWNYFEPDFLPADRKSARFPLLISEISCSHTDGKLVSALTGTPPYASALSGDHNPFNQILGGCMLFSPTAARAESLGCPMAYRPVSAPDSGLHSFVPLHPDIGNTKCGEASRTLQETNHEDFASSSSNDLFSSAKTPRPQQSALDGKLYISQPPERLQTNQDIENRKARRGSHIQKQSARREQASFLEEVPYPVTPNPYYTVLTSRHSNTTLETGKGYLRKFDRATLMFDTEGALSRIDQASLRYMEGLIMPPPFQEDCHFREPTLVTPSESSLSPECRKQPIAPPLHDATLIDSAPQWSHKGEDSIRGLAKPLPVSDSKFSTNIMDPGEGSISIPKSSEQERYQPAISPVKRRELARKSFNEHSSEGKSSSLNTVGQEIFEKEGRQHNAKIRACSAPVSPKSRRWFAGISAIETLERNVVSASASVGKESHIRMPPTEAPSPSLSCYATKFQGFQAKNLYIQETSPPYLISGVRSPADQIVQTEGPWSSHSYSGISEHTGRNIELRAKRLGVCEDCQASTVSLISEEVTRTAEPNSKNASAQTQWAGYNDFKSILPDLRGYSQHSSLEAPDMLPLRGNGGSSQHFCKARLTHHSIEHVTLVGGVRLKGNPRSSGSVGLLMGGMGARKHMRESSSLGLECVNQTGLLASMGSKKPNRCPRKACISCSHVGTQCDEGDARYLCQKRSSEFKVPELGSNRRRSDTEAAILQESTNSLGQIEREDSRYMNKPHHPDSQRLMRSGKFNTTHQVAKGIQTELGTAPRLIDRIASPTLLREEPNDHRSKELGTRKSHNDVLCISDLRQVNSASFPISGLQYDRSHREESSKHQKSLNGSHSAGFENVSHSADPARIKVKDEVRDFDSERSWKKLPVGDVAEFDTSEQPRFVKELKNERCSEIRYSSVPRYPERMLGKNNHPYYNPRARRYPGSKLASDTIIREERALRPVKSHQTHPTNSRENPDFKGTNLSFSHVKARGKPSELSTDLTRRAPRCATRITSYVKKTTYVGDYKNQGSKIGGASCSSAKANRDQLSGQIPYCFQVSFDKRASADGECNTKMGGSAEGRNSAHIEASDPPSSHYTPEEGRDAHVEGPLQVSAAALDQNKDHSETRCMLQTQGSETGDISRDTNQKQNRKECFERGWKPLTKPNRFSDASRVTHGKNTGRTYTQKHLNLHPDERKRLEQQTDSNHFGSSYESTLVSNSSERRGSDKLVKRSELCCKNYCSPNPQIALTANKRDEMDVYPGLPCRSDSIRIKKPNQKTASTESLYKSSQYRILSNKQVIKNALKHVCLAGEVNRELRESMMQRLDYGDLKDYSKFVVVHKDTMGSQHKFGALYARHRSSDVFVRKASIIRCPPTIKPDDPKFVQSCYRYDTELQFNHAEASNATLYESSSGPAKKQGSRQ